MKILVPTDFSRNAKTALDYAAGLARTLNASITLAHIIRPLSSKNLLSIDKKELEKNIVFELHELQVYLNNQFGLKSNVKVGIGDIAEEISKLAKHHHIDLIVMGTRGASGVTKMLFGSNTQEVIEKVKIPVMALPANAEFQRPSRIVFATDYNSSDVEDIKEVASFAGKFDASISAVHVVNRFTDEDIDFDIHMNEYFSDLVQTKVPYKKISCEEFQHADVAEGIRCFVQEENAEILALSHTHRTVIEKLFQKSLTNEFLFDIQIPLLVFNKPHL